jgi:hypothetical protein
MSFKERLAAMQDACVESFPDFRRYMVAKARLLGLDRLAVKVECTECHCFPF